MANRATSLSIAALVIAIAAFVWWNLQPDAVSLVSVGPDHCETESRGPGWPVPAYTGHSRWSRPDVPVGELFATPTEEAAAAGRRADTLSSREAAAAHEAFAARGRWNRWLKNAPIGLLLLAALIANLARAYREADVSPRSDAEPVSGTRDCPEN